MPRVIVFDWDYPAFPIWDPDTGACLEDPSALPVDPDLRADLIAWTERAPGTLLGDYDPAIVGATAAPPDEQERLLTWRSEGEVLHRRLVDDLGGDFDVRYGWTGNDSAADWAIREQ